MPASLTEKEFSQHLNTKYRVNLEPAGQVELELVEVKGYLSRANEQGGMERFSAYFAGPAESFLPQGTYAMEHDRMGQFDIFLVPIVSEESDVHYEAVFNYFKPKSDKDSQGDEL